MAAGIAALGGTLKLIPDDLLMSHLPPPAQLGQPPAPAFVAAPPATLAVMVDRASAMVRRMRLEKVTPKNYESALALSVRPDQQDLVAPVVKSLAEAYVFPDHAWPRLIYDGDRLVGFLMAFLDMPWDSGRSPDDLRSGLWRLNIAADAQGNGYGRFAVEAVCAEIRARGGTRVYVTWEPRAGGPEEFYLKLGFRTTGEQSGGEVVGVLDL